MNIKGFTQLPITLQPKGTKKPSVLPASPEQSDDHTSLSQAALESLKPQASRTRKALTGLARGAEALAVIAGIAGVAGGMFAIHTFTASQMPEIVPHFVKWASVIGLFPAGFALTNLLNGPDIRQPNLSVAKSGDRDPVAAGLAVYMDATVVLPSSAALGLATGLTIGGHAGLAAGLAAGLMTLYLGMHVTQVASEPGCWLMKDFHKKFKEMNDELAAYEQRELAARVPVSREVGGTEKGRP